MQFDFFYLFFPSFFLSFLLSFFFFFFFFLLSFCSSGEKQFIEPVAIQIFQPNASEEKAVIASQDWFSN